MVASAAAAVLARVVVELCSCRVTTWGKRRATSSLHCASDIALVECGGGSVGVAGGGADGRGVGIARGGGGAARWGATVD